MSSISDVLRSDEIIFEDGVSANHEENFKSLNLHKEAYKTAGVNSENYNNFSTFIESDSIDVIHSYQNFNGLEYNPNPKANYKHRDSKTEMDTLSIQERLASIKNDLNFLLDDISIMNGCSKGTDSNNADSSIWNMVELEAKSLLEKAKNINVDLNIVTVTNSSDIASDKNLGATVESANVESTDSTESNTLSPMSSVALEQRIAALEKMIGSGPINASNPSRDAKCSPILTTLCELEAKVALMNPTELESLRDKVKSVKNEMNQFLSSSVSIGDSNDRKGRFNSNTAGSDKRNANVSTVIEAAVMIEEMFKRSMDMDAIINDLPSIVVRLKTLERVHQSALSVDSRLEMLEGIVNDLSSEVSSNNEVILSLQEGIENNQRVYSENMHQVEHRIKGLQSE